MTPDITIGILLPTRQRSTLAMRSIESLCTTAVRPERIEVLLAIDQDDLDEGHRVTAFCREHSIRYQCWETPRLGYANLHRYVNGLAALSPTAAWYFIWNDDVIMQTHGWDEMLAKYADCLMVLSPKVVNVIIPKYEYALFPIVPSHWVRALGYISRSQHNDTYITDVADVLKIMWGLDGMRVYHDRFDETGNNQDTVYLERSYAWDTYIEDHNEHIMADAQRLKAYSESHDTKKYMVYLNNKGYAIDPAPQVGST